ncbi:hypothetical protein GCM10023353_15620 [Tomitella cavernea]|uniref:Uncharacterized protein n=1 Tax=Tomitella cavernea TaxID=1387982 RepID=A0ABP9CPT8_9ACTN
MCQSEVCRILMPPTVEHRTDKSATGDHPVPGVRAATDSADRAELMLLLLSSRCEPFAVGIDEGVVAL